MNKDVIYIEPENDITDIIAKIENAKERIVALVPPKNPAVLRSIVNIKLIMKAAGTHDKTVVLVTTDQSIIKLAAATRIPVTKNLQSAPTIPTVHEEEIKTESTEEVVETTKGEVEVTPVDAPDEATDDDKSSDEAEPAEPAKEPTKAKDAKKSPLANTKIGAFLAKYKRWCLIGAIALVVFIVFIVWALVIAPAVNIAVTVRTTSNNFSENITFTTNVNEEDAASGKFYLEEKKLETPIKIEFKATGTKNIGEKASGELVVYHYFNSQGTIDIPAGTNFTHNGHIYTNSAAASIAWDGTFDQCDNDITKLGESCVRSVTIKITATEPGEKYNLDANGNGWTSSRSGILVSRNSSVLAGGTDKVVTVVQQSDIDEAKKSITSSSESEAKAKLLEDLGDDMLVIDSSFKQTAGEINSSPKLGEEVAEGVTPAIETTTTASIFVIDKTKVEEFISNKARLSEDQKIYQLGNPFIENFLSSDSDYTGKLKTSYASGPKVTEEDIMNKSKGKKIGEVQSILKSINGVSTVSIEKSFFWVNSVPNDPNKITINLSLGE